MSNRSFSNAIVRALRSKELRQRPISAICRRVRWWMYWKRSPRASLVVKNWHKGLSISLPKTSNAALAFYRRPSDPHLAAIIEQTLPIGGRFVDIGAHIGEFTLIGARKVGPSGIVHAVEPLRPCADAIIRNAEINSMRTINVTCAAVSDTTGFVGYVSDPLHTAGWLAASADSAEFTTESWALDDLFSHWKLSTCDLMKLDAGGNELSALKGAAGLFSRSDAPVMIMKLYNPRVTQERFGYDSSESVEHLLSSGYGLSLCSASGRTAITSPNRTRSLFNEFSYTHLLLADKRPS